MFDQSFSSPPPLTTTVQIMLVVWCVILAPWLPIFTLMGTGMAFEGGRTPGAYLFVAVAWAYPILVGVAYSFRRTRPNFIWLPAIALVLAFATA